MIRFSRVLAPRPTRPLKLKIKFITHNSANIDPWAVKVIYEKKAPIDLTDWLRKSLRDLSICGFSGGPIVSREAQRSDKKC